MYMSCDVSRSENPCARSRRKPAVASRAVPIFHSPSTHAHCPCKGAGDEFFHGYHGHVHVHEYLPADLEPNLRRQDREHRPAFRRTPATDESRTTDCDRG